MVSMITITIAITITIKDTTTDAVTITFTTIAYYCYYNCLLLLLQFPTIVISVWCSFQVPWVVCL